MSKNLTRRELLKSSAAAAFGLTIIGPSLAEKASNLVPRSPHLRPRIAVIGAGGRGGAHVHNANLLGELVAICDIDANTRAQVMKENPYAAAFVDYRKMIDVMHNHIDAVMVATPDHNHAAATSLAMKAGKPVYCEKPLTRTIWEARRLGEIARETGVVTQMGNQGTAGDDLRQMAAAIKSGMFGKVQEVHCWTNRPGGWWAQGVERPAPSEKPKNVAWDEWIGPSPFRPYAEGYHGFAWRGWWDFGSGSLGDIGCHCMNLPFMALNLRNPIAVTAETSGHNKDSFPSWSTVKYEFAKSDSHDAINLYWYDGGKLPPQDILSGIEKPDVNGCVIVCDKAKIYAPREYGQDGQILGGEFDLSGVKFQKSPGHFEEWVEAIVEGDSKPMSNFDYAVPLTETVLLGNLAIWADGDRVEWDAGAMKAVGRTDVDLLIHPQYRPGWTL